MLRSGYNKRRGAEGGRGAHISDIYIYICMYKYIYVYIYIYISLLECPEVLTGAGLSDDDNFFSDPVKHFGRGDVWGAGVDDAPANEEVRQDEDNRDGPQVDDLAVEVEVLDCSDEVDAGVVFGAICREVDLVAEEVEKAANAEEAADAEGAANADDAANGSAKWHNTPVRMLYRW